MAGLDGMVGKRVLVFYQDGTASVARKDGVLKSADATFITLTRTSGEEAIPVAKLVRIEADK